MSDYINFLSAMERRNDDIRFAEQSRRGEFEPSGPILIEKLVQLLSSVRRNVPVWRMKFPKSRHFWMKHVLHRAKG